MSGTTSAAAGEGSGLLDIRSIARTLAPAAARARTERGSLDDLPVYEPVTFVEPAVLVPGSPRGRDHRLVWALAASIGCSADWIGIADQALASTAYAQSALARAKADYPAAGFVRLQRIGKSRWINPRQL